MIRKTLIPFVFKCLRVSGVTASSPEVLQPTSLSICVSVKSWGWIQTPILVSIPLASIKHGWRSRDDQYFDASCCQYLCTFRLTLERSSRVSCSGLSLLMEHLELGGRISPFIPVAWVFFGITKIWPCKSSASALSGHPRLLRNNSPTLLRTDALFTAVAEMSSWPKENAIIARI